MPIPILSDLRELIADVRDYREHLRSIKADAGPPILIADDVLGIFTYNRRGGWFETTRLWNGTDVDLMLKGSWPAEAPELDFAADLATEAHRFWQDESGWLDRLQACAVRDLLELANEWCVDEGPLSAAHFCQRITPTSIAVDEDSFEVWFSDGDVFAGHEILICGTWQDGPTGAGIHG